MVWWQIRVFSIQPACLYGFHQDYRLLRLLRGLKSNLGDLLCLQTSSCRFSSEAQEFALCDLQQHSRRLKVLIQQKILTFDKIIPANFEQLDVFEGFFVDHVQNLDHLVKWEWLGLKSLRVNHVKKILQRRNFYWFRLNRSAKDWKKITPEVKMPQRLWIWSASRFRWALSWFRTLRKTSLVIFEGLEIRSRARVLSLW